MTAPSRAAFVLIALGVALAIVGAAEPLALVLAVALDVCVVIGVLIEGRLLAGHRIVATRTWRRTPQVDVEGELTIEIEHSARVGARCRVRHVWSGAFEGPPLEQRVRLDPRCRLLVRAAGTPTARGPQRLPATELELSRGVGLAVRRILLDEPRTADVSMNLSSIRAYDTLRRSRALHRLGLHRQRAVGAGREFDQIREYVAGDDFRDVNWKSTARAGTPRTNLYRVERSRDVLICVDGGRLMGNPIGAKTALDLAVDAALLVSHASRDAGDHVGLITFRDRVDTVLRPGNSAASARLLLAALAAFDPRPVATSFLALHEAIEARQSRRALVIVMTDLSDPQLAEELVAVARSLSRRHLVLVVSLEDRLIGRVADSGARTEADVARVLAARQLGLERAAHAAELLHSGTQVLMADAERFSLELLDRYLAITARQMV